MPDVDSGDLHSTPSTDPEVTTPLVLIGPYAHHSSILPWSVICVQMWGVSQPLLLRSVLALPVTATRCAHPVELRKESLADVVFVNEEPGTGGVDMRHLSVLLTTYRHRSRRIGVFTAASNITGSLSVPLLERGEGHSVCTTAPCDYCVSLSAVTVLEHPYIVPGHDSCVSCY